MKYHKYLKDIESRDIKCIKSDVYCPITKENKFKNIKY